MPLQPVVREAIAAIKQDAHALLSGEQALVDKKQCTLMLSLHGCATILLEGYDSYVVILAAAEFPEEVEYYENTLTLSRHSINSIALSCEVIRRYAIQSPLSPAQLQHLESIEKNHQLIIAELRRWLGYEWAL